MQESIFESLSDAGPGTLAAGVRRLLKQVLWARLAPYGLSPQQLWVVLVLRQKGPSSLHPLARQVWMDDPTASRVVKTMVERGWLTAQPDPRHGRRILIDLAPAARPKVEELHGITTELGGTMTSGLSQEEQDVLSRGLRTMIDNLESLLVSAPDLSPAQNEAVAS